MNEIYDLLKTESVVITLLIAVATFLITAAIFLIEKFFSPLKKVLCPVQLEITDITFDEKEIDIVLFNKGENTVILKELEISIVPYFLEIITTAYNHTIPTSEELFLMLHDTGSQNNSFKLRLEIKSQSPERIKIMLGAGTAHQRFLMFNFNFHTNFNKIIKSEKYIHYRGTDVENFIVSSDLIFSEGMDNSEAILIKNSKKNRDVFKFIQRMEGHKSKAVISILDKNNAN